MNSRLTLACRQLGVADLCWYGFARALARCSGSRLTLHKYRLVAQPVRPALLCGARGASVRVREALATLAPESWRRPPEVIARRFALGARCLAAYAGDRLAGYLWFCTGPYHEDEVRACFIPPRGACWDFDVQVFGEHQLSYTFPRLWDEANRLLHAAGIAWTMSRISAFNAASRAAHARMGALELGSIVFLRCWHWQLAFATLAPYAHLSRGEASYPSFRLHMPAATP